MVALTLERLHAIQLALHECETSPEEARAVLKRWHLHGYMRIPLLLACIRVGDAYGKLARARCVPDEVGDVGRVGPLEGVSAGRTAPEADVGCRGGE